MWKALLAVALFGLLHPLSKPIFLSGLDANFFAFFFVLFRAVMTIPLVQWQNVSILRKRHIKPIIGIGAAGAALQLSEFYAIDIGVPVSVVSMLIFTLPLWTTLFGALLSNERPDRATLIPAGLILVGGLAVSFGMSGLPAAKLQLIWPVAAGMALGLWVCLSRILRMEGIQAVLLSFIYDSVSLIFILIFLLARHTTNDWAAAFSWLLTLEHLLGILAYTVFLGLIANLLFYAAASSIPANRLGLIMTLEPVMSISLSYVLYQEILAPIQILGAVLILVSNPPYPLFINLVPLSWRKVIENGTRAI